MIMIGGRLCLPSVMLKKNYREKALCLIGESVSRDLLVAKG